jgi:class 3 adenylate cyclase/tetratricopeptide (TPR) repeat protein
VGSDGGAHPGVADRVVDGYACQVRCHACGTGNEEGRKFCGECGAPLMIVCAACGTANSPGAKFCGECGSAFGTPVSARAPAAEPMAERRLVSVLFADLVGFTAASEARDAEDVRALLSRYFDTCRTLIDRYGGTVEKFIGDAVMAVWGAPVAMEDDAERAVRAAIDLAAAVEALGAEVGTDELRARVGVLTGEAAVTIGAQTEGMVAGDLVNTASRIQSVAEPGTVLVGESTKRATDAAVVYEDAGVRELKGKLRAVPVWRAVRVIGGIGGAQRTTGLEAPFVGRDRELRVVKELFHASAGESKAHLVSVLAVAGTGKSRLSWEFFKYIDGLAENVRWHRGRCLPYGEGVTFWALAEMVRTRAQIVEGEDTASQRAKLHAAVEESIADPEERRFIEPRLANLLGLEEHTRWERENLFSAWRLFYERLAEEMPTVLVFEDMEWADAALLDFIEYLVDWSRNHPLFVIVLARPELTERRPTWGAGRRNSSSLYLEPLATDEMEMLLSGLVPGLPEELRARIRERAEGMPLYAVETVRMLLDRGLVVERESSYIPAGPIETLEVPETLQALVAARLDGLGSEERRLLQSAAVLGKTFTVKALATLIGRTPEEVEPALTGLARKEMLSLSADPLSPERGQYGFLQDMVRRVAYEMLSKHERRAKHLAAAAMDEGEDELAEVVAGHYLAAAAADPDAADAGEIARRAVAALRQAGQRASSLAATQEAQRYYEQAAALATERAEQADLLEHAGIMAQRGGRADAATAHYERAVALFEEEGTTHPAARVSARLGEIMWDTGRLREALDRMDAALELLTAEEGDADVAALTAQIARFTFFAGDPEVALERVETALELAEALGLPEVLSHAINTKATILSTQGRPGEGGALIRYALEVALEHDVPSAALRAYNNVADLEARSDRYEHAAAGYRDGLVLARRVGSRQMEWMCLAQTYPLYALGRWDEALARAAEVPDDVFSQTRFPFVCFLGNSVSIHCHRGELDLADELIRRYAVLRDSADIAERSGYLWPESLVRLVRGDATEALRLASAAWDTRETSGGNSEAVKESFAIAVSAALLAGDRTRAEALLETVDSAGRGMIPPLVRAHTMRFRGRLAADAGDRERGDGLMRGAAALMRELATPFPMAVTMLEHAEVFLAAGDPAAAEPLLLEARSVFEDLRAVPWAERTARAAAQAGDRVAS